MNNGTGGTDVRLFSKRSWPPRHFESKLTPHDFSWMQICGLFIGAARSKPIHHAELTCITLGMDLQAWNDEGTLRSCAASLPQLLTDQMFHKP